MNLDASTNPRSEENGDIRFCDRILMTMVDLRLGDVPPTVPPADDRVHAACQEPHVGRDARVAPPSGSVQINALQTDSSITTKLDDTTMMMNIEEAKKLAENSDTVGCTTVAAADAGPTSHNQSGPLPCPSTASVPTTRQSVIISSPDRPSTPSWTGAVMSVPSQVSGHTNAISDSSSNGGRSENSPAAADPHTNKNITRITKSTGPAQADPSPQENLEPPFDLASEEDYNDNNNRNKTVNCDDSNMKTIRITLPPASPVPTAADAASTGPSLCSPAFATAKHSDNTTTTKVPHGDNNHRDLIKPNFEAKTDDDDDRFNEEDADNDYELGSSHGTDRHVVASLTEAAAAIKTDANVAVDTRSDPDQISVLTGVDESSPTASRRRCQSSDGSATDARGGLELSQKKADDVAPSPAADGQTNAKISLSGVEATLLQRQPICYKSAMKPIATGWRLPPGGGLRGGAPGETSAIANGTSNWGPPPPPNSTANTGVGGWGNAPPTSQGAVSAWATAVSTASSTTEDVSNGQKLLNSATKVSSPSTTMGTSSVPATSSTSWAAAAGKGILPTEQTTGQMNGATNKQLEQLNSVREALFSQDGWGVGNINQETSWDVGTSDSPPSVKADNMQWQAPSSRNDGTDLWKSTLSGVPQVAKPQPSTPWHNPRNPTDFKNWGDPDDEPGAASGAVGGAGMDEPSRGNHSWDDGVSGPGQPWDSDRGPSKGKDDGWNSGASNNHWGGGGASGPPGPGRPGPDMGGANWGSHPPPSKPNNWAAGGPAGAQGMMGAGGSGGPVHWPTESPTTNRRFDDGTSIWGGKSGHVANGPTGTSVGWKDMPTPNMGGSRPGGGPPGPPSRPPPGAGMKNEMSPWGQPHPNGRTAMGLSGGWGGDDSSPWMDDKAGGSVIGSGSGGNMGGWGNAGDGWGAPRGKSRGSPSWEDPTAGGAPGGVSGVPGMPGGGSGWNNNRMMPLHKESIWASKQFRILTEMGYRKEDVEVALRSSNMQVDEAHEMLKSSMGRGIGLPPSSDIGSGFVRSTDYDVGMRFPPGGMPSYPPGELPPNSLQNAGRGGPASALNPALVQQMPLGGNPGPSGHPGGAPPRPSTAGGSNGGPPTTNHLRLLVQQIQMAVQAGHLNAQILNQPLAPQTLLLLNQLLQQIKGLQQCQHQYTVAQATGARSSMSQLSVQITKHKQQITNLQNQITAQQAQYLKNQQHQSIGGGTTAIGQAGSFPGGPSGVGQDNELSLGLGNLSMGSADHNAGPQPGGSKLNKWIKSDVGALNAGSEMPDFSRAPGSTSNSTTATTKPNSNSQSSPNLLLGDANGPWSNGTNGSVGSGWPDSTGHSGSASNGSLIGNGNNNNMGGGGHNEKGNNANDDNDFGIPEFVPGKAWKGPGVKDPTEDPTLTPGSVASTSIVLQQGGTNSSKDGSGKPQTVSSSTSAGLENSMIPTSSTWSFGNNSSSGMRDPSSIMLGGLKDNWGSSSSSQTLTAMGHDLWGQSRSSSKLMPSSSVAGGSAWPSSNGWSNGTNMPAGAASSSWLLLKNLTAQIDGSTLRTLCMQHGPLNSFHLYLTQGIALVKYSNASEAKKAQSALHNCVLGNTTIFAIVAGEHDVQEIAGNLAQTNSSGQNRGGGGAGNGGHPLGYPVQLNRSGSTDTCWSSGLSNNTSPWPTSGLGGNVSVSSGSVWGVGSDDQHNRTTPLDFLPPDLLSETM